MNTRQIFILMIGAPGVGKGTYSRILSKELKLQELSSGDELRKLVKLKSKSSQGHEEVSDIKRIMDEGKLVNDIFMFEFMRKKLEGEDYKNGAILDGYPRTIIQAKKFEEKRKINLVVKIDLNEDILVRKLLGRRVCQKCGKGYNVCNIREGPYDMEPLLPKENNKCDDCNSKLIQREDDTESIIKSRIKLYKELTRPLEDYYQNKNIVKLFEPFRGLKDYPALSQLVGKYLTPH
jgi:adenylate kinase